MIKLMRVDYRLIHGQVAMAWTHTIGADCILVAGDVIAADDMRKATLRLARPSGVKLVIKDIMEKPEMKYGLLILFLWRWLYRQLLKGKAIVI